MKWTAEFTVEFTPLPEEMEEAYWTAVRYFAEVLEELIMKDEKEMKLIENKEKKLFQSLTDTSAWPDGEVILNKEEIEVLIAAQKICEKAHQMTVQATHDPDNYNSFGQTDLALLDVIKEQKK